MALVSWVKHSRLLPLTMGYVHYRCCHLPRGRLLRRQAQRFAAQQATESGTQMRRIRAKEAPPACCALIDGQGKLGRRFRSRYAQLRLESKNLRGLKGGK